MFRRSGLAVVVALTSLAAQADVTKATLYPSHAEITWEETVQAVAGSGVLEVKGLPVSLQDQSVRVALEGLTGAKIRQIEIKREEQSEYVDQATVVIRGQLENVKDQLQAKQDEIRAWEQTVTLMSRAVQSPGESTASELDEKAYAVRENTLKALNQIRLTRNDMKALQSEKDRLERQIAQVAQGAKATKKVLIHYQAPQPGALDATLEFQTSGAGWRSEYSARLQTGVDGTAKGELAIEHQAVVSQVTGVDWKGVELRLSTASSHQGTAMPEPHSWVVRAHKPIPQSSSYDEVSSLMAKAVTPESVARTGAAVVSQSTFTQHYEIQHPVDVPSDRTGHRLTIAEHILPVDVETWVAPVLNTRGYLHVTGSFQSDAPIPAGPAMLYRDGQSVGQRSIPELADGEEFSFGFGVDDGLRVTVANEIERSGEEGVWKSENVLRRQNRFDITNHHQAQVQVRVFDRIPVSQQDELKVSPMKISSPVEQNVDDKKGVMAWTRVVPAGESVQIHSGFEVRVPEGLALPRL